MSGGIQVPRTVSHTYDADSNQKTMTYPSGTTLTYGYNTRNQLMSKSDAVSAVVSYTYDLSGNRRTRTLRNGTTSTYTPDALNRPLLVKHDRGASTLGRFDYSYDSVNRVEWVKRDLSRGDSYEYYLDDQLKRSDFDAMHVDSSLWGAANSTELVYDPNGNRVTQTNSGGSAPTPNYTYSVNDLNQYTSVNGGVPEYDTKGNLTAHNGVNYVYHADSRLIGAANNTVRFYHDGLGRQILRYVNGQWIYSIWDGWNLIEEWNEQNVLLNVYIHGAGTDEMVQRYNGGGGNAIWYYQDAQGSTTHLADDGGNVVEKYMYDPAKGGAPTIYNATGQLRAASAYNNRFLYTGRDWLKEAAIYDYRNRFYHPGLGRFMQPDPIGFAAGDRNLYRYCGGDPVNRTDPTGLLDGPLYQPTPVPLGESNPTFDAWVAEWLFGDWIRSLGPTPAPVPPPEPLGPPLPFDPPIYESPDGRTYDANGVRISYLFAVGMTQTTGGTRYTSVGRTQAQIDAIMAQHTQNVIAGRVNVSSLGDLNWALAGGGRFGSMAGVGQRDRGSGPGPGSYTREMMGWDATDSGASRGGRGATTPDDLGISPSGLRPGTANYAAIRERWESLHGSDAPGR